MSIYYQDELVTLYHGDCRELHGWLYADVLVTDPPYGRAWKQGDTTTARGWKSDKHDGIANDSTTAIRDAALAAWNARPAIVFGDLLLPPPRGAKHVLVYDKGGDAGFTGAVGGYRRNVEAIYLLGNHGSGLGGRSAIIRTSASAGGNLARTTGHPHTKPLDVMKTLVKYAPHGLIADPFAGSGSTLVAAKQLGRRAVGVELEEEVLRDGSQAVVARGSGLWGERMTDVKTYLRETRDKVDASLGGDGGPQPWFSTVEEQLVRLFDEAQNRVTTLDAHAPGVLDAIESVARAWRGEL